MWGLASRCEYVREAKSEAFGVTLLLHLSVSTQSTVYAHIRSLASNIPLPFGQVLI